MMQKKIDSFNTNTIRKTVEFTDSTFCILGKRIIEFEYIGTHCCCAGDIYFYIFSMNFNAFVMKGYENNFARPITMTYPNRLNCGGNIA